MNDYKPDYNDFVWGVDPDDLYDARRDYRLTYGDNRDDFGNYYDDDYDHYR